MQRKQYWWLPYLVLEFDKNEILVEALGGDLSKPEWNHRADLYVFASFSAFSIIVSPHLASWHCEHHWGLWMLFCY